MFSTAPITTLLALITLALVRQLLKTARLRKSDNKQEAAFYVMMHPRKSPLRDLPSSSKHTRDEEGRCGRAKVRISSGGRPLETGGVCRWWHVWVDFPPLWWERLLRLPDVIGAEFSFSEICRTGEPASNEQGDLRAKTLFELVYSTRLRK